ncbi:MAG: efflux RND transporter permease subunit, partial [Gammaproteobacteria bacterium]|nr:efflux RND transporter permease subunit [Gammaproteobacteria bacterium]
TVHGASSGRGRSISGPRIGSVYVELSAPDERQTTNAEFVRAWRKRVRQTAGVESLTIASRRTGPSSRDLDVRLTGSDPENVKAAALQLAEAIKAVPGTSAVDDDLPYGREQLIYELTPAGAALGLSIASLGKQLRTAYEGAVVQRFQDGADEVEVRIELPQHQQQRLRSLDELPIRLPQGDFAPLASVARWSHKQGFENLRHAGGRLAANVSANVDPAVASVDAIESALRETTLAQLAQAYGIDYSFEGRSRRQRDTLSDMRTGMAIGLLLIYLVLAWVFSSYGWPLLVMTAIPLGLSGAILGHWAMGMNLTILSLFGFFGLSGIVVNDSIILVTFYKRLRAAGTAVGEALIEAACQRLRAVLLTSLTTIAGLTPLLFETSRQAQFLIPMATSIAFGLAFATILILVVLPAMLSVYEEWAARWRSDAATEAYA